MTSYLIDKLEALKEDENKLKEEQRVLQEEIELEIEKNRRLELDGTIIKLRTQVDEIRKNIEGEIMPDNRLLVLKFGKHNYYYVIEPLQVNNCLYFIENQAVKYWRITVRAEQNQTAVILQETMALSTKPTGICPTTKYKLNSYVQSWRKLR